MKINIFRNLFIIISIVSTYTLAYADDFVDYDAPRKMVSVGVRLGVNTSSVGINFDDIYGDMKHFDNNWHAGFDAGAVVNLNIRNYFTLQPGFFFQNKSYNSTLITANFDEGKLKNSFHHSRYYYFQIPVLASFRFNVSHGIKWLIDVGPYFAFGLGGDTEIETYSTEVREDGSSVIQRAEYKHDYFGDSNGTDVLMKSFDWGLKFGTGIMFHEKYSFGIYYNLGLKNIGHDHENFLHEPSVKNKQITFVLGYDF